MRWILAGSSVVCTISDRKRWWCCWRCTCCKWSLPERNCRREVNWWLGLLLMGVVLGLSLTGYLLPWDQKGFWAMRVATNIAGTLPVIGPAIAKFAVGGPEYGNATLTRFFALHVAILPPLLIGLLIAHIAVFRRHGITTVEPPDCPTQGVFWPDQVFKDLVACLVIFGIMVSLVVFGGHGNKIETETATSAESAGLYEDWAKAGRKGLGANLDAPADPGTDAIQRGRNGTFCSCSSC